MAVLGGLSDVERRHKNIDKKAAGKLTFAGCFLRSLMTHDRWLVVEMFKLVMQNLAQEKPGTLFFRIGEKV